MAERGRNGAVGARAPVDAADPAGRSVECATRIEVLRTRDGSSAAVLVPSRSTAPESFVSHGFRRAFGRSRPGIRASCGTDTPKHRLIARRAVNTISGRPGK